MNRIFKNLHWREKLIFQQLIVNFVDFRRNNSKFVQKIALLKNIICGEISCFGSKLRISPVLGEIIVNLCKKITHLKNIIHGENSYFSN